MRYITVALLRLWKACQESENREASQTSGQEEREARRRSHQQEGRSNRDDESRQGRHPRGNHEGPGLAGAHCARLRQHPREQGRSKGRLTGPQPTADAIFSLLPRNRNIPDPPCSDE